MLEKNDYINRSYQYFHKTIIIGISLVENSNNSYQSHHYISSWKFLWNVECDKYSKHISTWLWLTVREHWVMLWIWEITLE